MMWSAVGRPHHVHEEAALVQVLHHQPQLLQWCPGSRWGRDMFSYHLFHLLCSLHSQAGVTIVRVVILGRDSNEVSANIFNGKKGQIFFINPNCQEYSMHWLSHPELTVLGKKILQNLHIQGVTRSLNKRAGERRLYYYRDCRARGGGFPLHPMGELRGWLVASSPRKLLIVTARWQMVNHHLNKIFLPRTEKAGVGERIVW